MPSPQGSMGAPGKSGEDKNSKRIAKFLSNPWWAGISAIAAVLAVGGAVAAVIAILPSDQHPTQAHSVDSVQFTDLSKTTTYRYGIVLFYPSNWNQRNLPANNDGVEFTNPDDSNVSITAFGTHSISGYDSRTPPTILDVEKGWITDIRSMKDAKVMKEVPTGTTIEYEGTGYPLDAWVVIYQYTNDNGISMTDMVKTAYASGREVNLLMEAPTREFPRYQPAFLQLSEKLLVLLNCEDCSA